jgi:hypothetical protein
VGLAERGISRVNFCKDMEEFGEEVSQNSPINLFLFFSGGTMG